MPESELSEKFPKLADLEDAWSQVEFYWEDLAKEDYEAAYESVREIHRILVDVMKEVEDAERILRRSFVPEEEVRKIKDVAEFGGVYRQPENTYGDPIEGEKPS